MVDFNPHPIIDSIVNRAILMTPGQTGSAMSIHMDLAAANGVNGNHPLDLEALAAADDFNFAHDVFGIIRHIDRDTGKLKHHFVPRFAVRTQENADV